jgi:hypothetical protein
MTITDVGALDGDYFNVEFENGHSVMFTLKNRIHEPPFAALIENKTFGKPKTDGKRLYWQGGSSLSFDEIMAAVAGGNLAERTITRVDACEGDPEAIDIDLDNGSVITIVLKSKRSEPLLAGTAAARFLPKTDGKRVYRDNGASLTLDGIAAMLRGGNSAGQH